MFAASTVTLFRASANTTKLLGNRQFGIREIPYFHKDTSIKIHTCIKERPEAGRNILDKSYHGALSMADKI